jgi:hypothetical protein
MIESLHGEEKEHRRRAQFDDDGRRRKVVIWPQEQTIYWTILEQKQEWLSAGTEKDTFS